MHHHFHFHSIACHILVVVQINIEIYKSLFMGDNNNMANEKLPPGFRFYPTDEELIVHFLHRKAALLPCHPDVIPDLDLYPYDPWELDGMI